MHKGCSFFLCIITNRRFEQPAAFCAEATIKKSDRLTKRSDLVLVGAGGFGPPKRNATDLQSAPFGHSGTPPYSVFTAPVPRPPEAAKESEPSETDCALTMWSWWTDSNPRPADYKSAALPTELHQHLLRCSISD